MFAFKRYLALALTLCFHVSGIDSGLQLKLFPADLAEERGAQCLDSSPAGYFIREQDPNKWVVWLEGGGVCVETFDCISRKNSAWGSSKYWDSKKPFLPLGSTTTSPLSAHQNFSHVYVPYCSGDLWLGTSAKKHAWGMQMSGHLIIDVLVERLVNTTSFASATDVVFGGTSAGGIAVYQQVDWFADKVRSLVKSTQKHTPKVTGLAVAGLFFPVRWPVLLTTFVFGHHGSTTVDFVSKYLASIEEPYLHPECVKASRRNEIKREHCFDVSKMLHYTNTPIFTAMNRFDSLQVQGLGLCSSCSADDGPAANSGKFIRYFGAVLNETVLQFGKKLRHSGWFIPSEFSHDNNFYRFVQIQERKIEGFSYRAAYERWYAGENVTLIEATCNSEGPCLSSSHGMPDWGEREANVATSWERANRHFFDSNGIRAREAVQGYPWFWPLLALALLCCGGLVAACFCKRSRKETGTEPWLAADAPNKDRSATFSDFSATFSDSSARNFSRAPELAGIASDDAVTQPQMMASTAARLFSLPTAQGYQSLQPIRRS